MSYEIDCLNKIPSTALSTINEEVAPMTGSNPLWSVSAGLTLGSALLLAAGRRIHQLDRENRHLRDHTTDAVTGLVNRATWEAEACTRLHAAPQRVTLIAADLDDFKAINDEYGHPAGDQVLAEVADRLRVSFGHRNALVTRLGGDEFGVLAEDVDARELDRIVQAMTTSVPITDSPGIKVSASIGIARCGLLPAPVSLSDALLDADHRLYQAKRRHHNRKLRTHASRTPGRQ